MKIKKFEKNYYSSDDCWVCMIIGENIIINSASFDNESDMEYWLLNLINDEINISYNIYNINTFEKAHENSEGEYVFIDLADAINWYQDVMNCDIYYEHSQFIKNETLLYGVKELRDIKKYNL